MNREIQEHITRLLDDALKEAHTVQVRKCLATRIRGERWLGLGIATCVVALQPAILTLLLLHLRWAVVWGLSASAILLLAGGAAACWGSNTLARLQRELERPA